MMSCLFVKTYIRVKTKIWLVVFGAKLDNNLQTCLRTKLLLECFN